MTLYSLTYDDMTDMVGALNRYHCIDATIMNKGQLEFALEKPDTSFGGMEQYPVLHQKVSILMETICKSHCLSDGNKRASMMAASYLASANEATLVLPLKSIQLTVDCAMDADDRMTDELSMWFKTHIAHNPLQLSVMREELIEEVQVITALKKQGKHKEAERLVGTWLAFDNYPEAKVLWMELLKKWDERNKVLESEPKALDSAFLPWLSLRTTLGIDDSIREVIKLSDERIADPLYTGHGMRELTKIDHYIQERLSSVDTSGLEQAGLILEASHNHKGASWVYDKLLKAKGPIPDIMRHQSLNLVFSGQYEKAVVLINRLLTSNPNSVYLNKLKVEACYHLEDYASALKSASLILKQNPHDLQVLKTKVDIIRGSDPREAQKLDEAIYCLDPDDPVSISNMAASLSDRDMNAKAIKMFDKVLEIDDQNTSALYSKGLCLSRMGDNEAALTYYGKSLLIDPDFIRALINTGMIYAETEPAKALPYLEKASNLDPRHPVGMLGMGRVLLALDRVQESVETLEALRSIDPRNQACLYFLAAAYAKHDKVIHSLDVVESLVDIDPSCKTRLKTDPFFSKLHGLKRFQEL